MKRARLTQSRPASFLVTPAARSGGSLGCLFAAAIFLLTSCGGGASAATRPRVVAIGDSITHLSAPEIRAELGAHYQVDIQAHSGKMIGQMLPALRAAMNSHPFAVIENLGTNDAIQFRAHFDWKQNWNQLISLTRNTPCVVLTTINSAADYYGGGTIGTQINAAITSLVAKDPGKYKEVDWNGFLLRRVHTTLGTYLSGDLIHPLPAGRQEIASLDNAALAQCQR